MNNHYYLFSEQKKILSAAHMDEKEPLLTLLATPVYQKNKSHPL